MEKGSVERRPLFLFVPPALHYCTANELHPYPSERRSSNTTRRLHVRQILLCLSLLFFVSACETTTDPFFGFGGTPGLTQAQASGNWSFTLQRTSTLGCTGG